VPLAKSHSAHRKRSALLLTAIKLIIQRIKKCRENQERWRKKIHIRSDLTKLFSDSSTRTDRRNFAPTNQKDEATASGTQDSQCRSRRQGKLLPVKQPAVGTSMKDGW
jgi:hypothetical protein